MTWKLSVARCVSACSLIYATTAALGASGSYKYAAAQAAFYVGAWLLGYVSNSKGETK